eukprot:Nk52_evm49s2152 gene=Nk52_evmTU49s2152
MEKYEFVRNLGKGSQGSVHLVRNIEDKSLCVMKRIECPSQTAMEKAIKEATYLKKLDHKNICGYKEYFIIGGETGKDEEKKGGGKGTPLTDMMGGVGSSYLCILMDYYEKGDLGMLIKSKRNKSEGFTLNEIKALFGQIYYAVHFVHKHRFIHRDLKPSNLFLAKDGTLILGDFGVSTVMEDDRTRTRTTVGTLSWCAPEVLDQAQYDERSDIWSLGCILIALATTKVYDEGDIHQALMDIKRSSRGLERVLDDVRAQYDGALCQFLRTILRRNYKQRPTAKELLLLPFVQSCVRLVKKATSINSLNTIDSPVDLPSKDRSAKNILKTTKQHPQNMGYHVKALLHLQKYCPISEFPDDGVETIGQSIINHLSNDNIQRLGLALFRQLLMDQKKKQACHSAAFIEPILYIIRCYPSAATQGFFASSTNNVTDMVREMMISRPSTSQAASSCDSLPSLSSASPALGRKPSANRGSSASSSRRVEAQTTGKTAATENDVSILLQALNLVRELSVNDKPSEIIGEKGGVQDLLSAINGHIKNPEIVTAACSTLWSLAVNEDNLEIIKTEQGVETILSAMKFHIYNRDVLESTLSALWSLSVDDENVESIYELGGVELIVNVIAQHPRDKALLNQACVTLTTLVVDEYCALRVAFNDDNVNGVAILLKMLCEMAQDVEVVESCCSLFSELAEHKDILGVLTLEKVGPVLKRLKGVYKSNPKIKAACKAVLGKLST